MAVSSASVSFMFSASVKGLLNGPSSTRNGLARYLKTRLSSPWMHLLTNIFLPSHIAQASKEAQQLDSAIDGAGHHRSRYRSARRVNQPVPDIPKLDQSPRDRRGDDALLGPALPCIWSGASCANVLSISIPSRTSIMPGLYRTGFGCGCLQRSRPRPNGV